MSHNLMPCVHSVSKQEWCLECVRTFLPGAATSSDKKGERSSMPSGFEYLLNEMEHAAQQKNPASHAYAEKRRAVFQHVEDLWDDYMRLLREKQDRLDASVSATREPFTEYERNILGSLENWLRTRSATKWAEDYGHTGLMVEYAAALKALLNRDISEGGQ